MSVSPIPSFSSLSLLLEGPLNMSPPLESSEEQVTCVVDKWAEIAKGLPADDYHTCMCNIKQMARNILQQIDAFVLSGSTQKQLQKQTLIFIEQLELSAEKLFQNQNQYRKKQGDVRQELADIDKSLGMLSLPAHPLFAHNHQEALLSWNRVQQNLVVPQSGDRSRGSAAMARWSVASIPRSVDNLEFERHHSDPSSTDRSSPILMQYQSPRDRSNLGHSEPLKFQVLDRSRYSEDPQVEPRGLFETALSNREKADRLGVAIVANLLEASNEAIVWGAKKVCGLHPVISSACSEGKQLVVEGVQIVGEHLPDVVKATASKVSQMHEDALSISAWQDQRKLGIPEEETRRYHRNLISIGLEALSFVGGFGKAVAVGRKSGKAATELFVHKIQDAHTIHMKGLSKVAPRKIPIHLQENLADVLLHSELDSLLQEIPSFLPNHYHFSEQTVRELAHKANPRIAVEHITLYKGGEDFVVRVGKGEHSVVIKGADTYQGIYEAVGLQFFDTLKLKNIHFTPPIDIVRNESRFVLVKPYAPGKTIKSWISQCVQEKLPLEWATESIGQLGKAYAELQQVSSHYGIVLSQRQKFFDFHSDFLHETLSDANFALQKLRQSKIALTDVQIATFSRQWQQAESFAGFGFSDVGLSNFVYSKNKGLFFIDGEFLTHGINRVGQPLMPIDRDLSIIVSELLAIPISRGMSAENAHVLLDHFLHQLHQPVQPLPLLMGKIDAVKEILHDTPLRKSLDRKEVEKLVRRINEDVIKLME